MGGESPFGGAALAPVSGKCVRMEVALRWSHTPAVTAVGDGRAWPAPQEPASLLSLPLRSCQLFRSIWEGDSVGTDAFGQLPFERTSPLRRVLETFLLRLEFFLLSASLLDGAALAGRAAKPGQTAGPESRGHHWVKEMEAWDWERIHSSCRGSALSQVWSWQVIALLLRGSG